jgi:hypothetical protein
MPLGVHHRVVDTRANCITGRLNILVGLKGGSDGHLVNWNHFGYDFISGVQGGGAYRVEVTKQENTAVHSDPFRRL